MIRATALAAPALAVLALALSPTLVLAQTAPPPPPPAAAGAADAAVTEADIEAEGEAFGEAMEAMMKEMGEAVSAAGGPIPARAQLDAIQAKYQPGADSFADKLSRFIDAQMATVPEEGRAQMAAAKGAVGQIRGAPAMARQRLEQQAAAHTGG